MINIDILKGEIPIGEDFDTGLLRPKEELYRKFWKNGREGPLNPIVARKLMQIADNITKNLNIDVDPKDIIITGSIASYNWHDLSDIDLHILYDFEEINEDFELVKKMLNETRINWNRTHNIKIAGKEVELYFQHAYEPHESNGIWSLTLEKWLSLPVSLNPKLDLKNSSKKAEAVVGNIEFLFDLFKREKFREAYEYAGKVKSKIARMRKCGLDSEGIYSPENLAFKMLRNSGYLEKLSFLKIEAYDRMMSLKVESNNINVSKVWNKFIK